MTSKEDTNVKIQVRWGQKRDMDRFEIQVRQGSKKIIQLISGIGH